MKLAINLYLCSSLVALAEATNFARKAGLPLDKFNQAVTAGHVGCWR
jgi:3-hydroxyisobutyrate dehydrogenase-like beta-hydroxyacid dehydrogenase